MESVLHDAKHASVIIDGGCIKTVSRRDIVNAAARMKDTSTEANKAWETPVYLQRFSNDAVQSLDVLWQEFFTKTPEEQAETLRVSHAEFTSRKTCKKAPHSPEATKPKQVRSKWKMNTQVAKNKHVLAGGWCC